MNEVKFNTQICTTREQSERLLAMGVNPETADMVHYKSASMKEWGVLPCSFTEECSWYPKTYFPAWSLHRLIELLPQHIHLDDYADTHYWLVIDPLKVIYKNSYSSWIYQCDEGGLYDKLINTIEWTINHNHFNKEYLKQ